MKNQRYVPPNRRRSRFLPTPRDRAILNVLNVHGRLTVDQVRRLFFRRAQGQLATPQAVTARLRALSRAGLLQTAVVDAGHGSGPYAYGLTSAGRLTIGGRSHRGTPGPVWHDLEVAELRIRLQAALEHEGGKLAEWLGESQLRSLSQRRPGWPVPDGLAHWRLPGREGLFCLEWDRGTETLGVLAAKLGRYASFWRAHAHHNLVPGLGLRPRLAVVVSSRERAIRLTRWLGGRRYELRTTTLIGTKQEALTEPLGAHWWRSDTNAYGTIHE